MKLIPKKCIEYNEARKVCVAEEKGKKFTLKNDSEFRVQKVKIDGCITQFPNGRRCDYLMIIGEAKRPVVFFIELKGGDINGAIKQIINTIAFFLNDFSHHIMHARIVGSRSVPRITNTINYRKLLKFTKSSSGTIIIRSNKALTENL